MRKSVFLMSVVFFCTSATCSAAEPSKPKENLNQRASNAVKDIGDNMNKAGVAIKKSVDSAEKNVKDAGKGKGGTDAKHALQTLEAGADKAEHAIVNTVKGMGKPSATKGGAAKPGDKNKGPSLDQSMKDFGKNAEKAGTAMENGVKKLGSEASKQVGKADQAIKKKTDSHK